MADRITCRYNWIGVIVLVMLLASCAPAKGTATPTDIAPATETPPAATLTTTPSPTQADATATPTRIQYTIRPGDTLSGLARQFGVSMAAIQLASGLGESTALRAGQPLTIPTGLTWSGESSFWIAHLVKPGETLASIAQTFNVKADTLARINGLADPSLIRVGQAIVIPLDSMWVAVATPSLTPTRTSTPKPTTPASPLVTPARLSPIATLTPRPATATVTRPPVTVPSDLAAWPSAVIALINQKRAAHGLPPFNTSPELMRAARDHANDCRAHDWCGHVTSDGADTRTRLVRAGYTPIFYGENWVQANDPTGAVNWWYNEPPGQDPHRQNLLNTHYADVGVGVAQADFGYYFIANFGSR